jgi:hypothetical protein
MAVGSLYVLLICADRSDYDFSARHNSLGCIRDDASQRGGCALTQCCVGQHRES